MPLAIFEFFPSVDRLVHPKWLNITERNSQMFSAFHLSRTKSTWKNSKECILTDQFIAMVNNIYLLLICLGFYQGATQAVVWQYNRDLRFIWHFDGLVDGPRPRHPIPPCFLYFVERRKVIFTQDAFSLHILKRWEVLVQKMICGKSVFVFLTCYACCGKDNHITIVFSSQTWQHHWWSPKYIMGGKRHCLKTLSKWNVGVPLWI